MGRMRNRNYIFRFTAVLLAVMLLAAVVPAAYADEMSGSCGDKLTWSFSEGTLTVEGSGEMDNYGDNSPAPWSELREQVTRLVLPEGLTSIGDMAFYHFTRLTSVDVPDRVTKIGEYAFAGCDRLVMVDLGDSLSTVGDGAFYGCKGIISLRLPESLERIGMDAFYSCWSLTAITIPANVHTVGTAAFAYCTSLVRAELRNAVASVPSWIFFGCEQLTTVILPDTVTSVGSSAFRECDNLYYVCYGGESMELEELESSIAQDVPGFQITGNVTADRPNDTVTSTAETQKPDGTVAVQNTTVIESTNASVSSTVEHVQNEEQTVSAGITVTVENESGWQEATEAVDRLVGSMTEQTSGSGPAQITVYMKDTDKLEQSFVDTLAGRNVTVTVVAKDGSSWKIDCSEMNSRELSGTYDLSYTISPASKEKCEQMNVKKAYLLQFSGKAQVNAELLILLSDEAVRQNATLFQQGERGALIRHQTVMVDAEGYAHFFLGSVTDETEYYIGLNVPGTEEDVIIPDSLQGEFGVDYAQPVEYIITGRTSSWGMEIGQVTWILVGVMVGAVVIVGIVMFSLNKRRLKRGYIPDISEK